MIEREIFLALSLLLQLSRSEETFSRAEPTFPAAKMSETQLKTTVYLEAHSIFQLYLAT
jgi:hypothetical protein